MKLLDDLSRILESNPFELIHFENYEYNHHNGNGSGTEDLKKQYKAILRLHEEKSRHLEAEIIYLRHLLEKKMIPIK